MGEGAVVAIQPANHVLSAPARSVGVRITANGKPRAVRDDVIRLGPPSGVADSGAEVSWR